MRDRASVEKAGAWFEPRDREFCSRIMVIRSSFLLESSLKSDLGILFYFILLQRLRFKWHKESFFYCH